MRVYLVYPRDSEFCVKQMPPQWMLIEPQAPAGFTFLHEIYPCTDVSDRKVKKDRSIHKSWIRRIGEFPCSEGCSLCTSALLMRTAYNFHPRYRGFGQPLQPGIKNRWLLRFFCWECMGSKLDLTCFFGSHFPAGFPRFSSKSVA